MSGESTVRILIVVALAVFVTVLKKPKRTHPKTATVVGKTMRLTKGTLIVGCIFTAVGIGSLVLSFAGPPETKYPALTFGLFLFLFAGVLFAFYRNWYVKMDEEEIILRTVTKKITRIRYDQVDTAHIEQNGRGVMLRIRSADGTKLSADARYIDAEAVIYKIQQVRAAQRLAQLPPPQGQSPYATPPGGPSPYGPFN